MTRRMLRLTIPVAVGAGGAGGAGGVGRWGSGGSSRSVGSASALARNAIKAAIGTPTPDRLLKVAQAMVQRMKVRRSGGALRRSQTMWVVRVARTR